jgi:hypothetical protein
MGDYLLSKRSLPNVTQARVHIGYSKCLSPPTGLLGSSQKSKGISSPKRHADSAGANVIYREEISSKICRNGWVKVVRNYRLAKSHGGIHKARGSRDCSKVEA